MRHQASPDSDGSSSDTIECAILESHARLESEGSHQSCESNGSPNGGPGPVAHQGPGSLSGRQPLSRRGHFKSRLGCFNCKRRRVKCNEQRPMCSPCRRLGLSCVFPTSPSSAPGPVRTNPSSLTLEDLRFYHQFLTVAFPPLPLSSKDTWIEGAAMSHQYECLAHAVLGLGASHLSQNSDGDYTAQALQHRVVAIKLVNEQLDHPPQKPADADALLATVICLVSQSSLMPDSMVEYLTMTRGCNLVTFTILPDFERSIFKTFRPKWHMEAIAELASEQPRDEILIEGFKSSVLGLTDLCHHSYEIRFLESLLQCIKALDVSAFEAWKEFVTVFMVPTTFTNEEFLAFINPENYIGHLVTIHMFLLDYLLGQFCIAPSKGPGEKCLGRMKVIISWARILANKLPPPYQKYMDWPLHYCDQLAHHDGRYLLSP